MKLHLPHTLRTALLCTFSLVTTLGTFNTYAAGLHSQVGMVTYTDFGQNMGRYRVNGVNDLLSSIRTRDGGVNIYYQEGHDDFLLPHYMISYESQGDNGAYAAVGYNFIATVAHNGCQNPTFTGRYINGADSLHYYGVEYRSNITFCLQPGDVVFSSNWAYDFKMTRLNKLITDVTTSDLMPRFPDDFDYSQLHGLMEYRAGSGTMSIRHLDRSKEGLTGAYAYVTGAVQTITAGGTTSREWDCFTAGGNLNPSAAGINDSAPLPFVGAAGDSGSPVWLWDDESQSYLYLAAYQSGSDWYGQARGSINFAWDSLTKFDELIDMEQGASRTVHIKGVTAKPGDREISDGTHTTLLHMGRVEDGRGNLITDYVGVKGDDDRYIHTWLNLAPLKDQASWFATNNKYYNVGSYKEDNVTTQRELEIEDLFNDSNLVFSASTETGNVVAVDEDADLGIGYLQFSINPDSHLTHAEFTLQSNGKTADGRGGQRDYMVNSAGFVVEQGVDLRVKLTNTQWDSAANDYYYREWRKVGDGNLYLEGQGSNQIFLNVGGKGTTYLKETGGYAAYNVYAGSGATVVMESLDQIARDFTFGYNGGTLDIRGNHSMDWYRTNPNVAAQGFSINSFSEDSYITNSQDGTTLNLTYRQGGETEYLGSFVDTEDGGAVRIVFDAGFEANTILHSIHTSLHNAGSGITVKSGSVTLAGSNTVHAMGSATGRNTARYFSDEDWHYADMATDVLVQGGTFVLGSHARLKGNVSLTSTGSLIIHEGVRNAYEYIEGGIRKEDTTTEFYRQFYGLKGNISTAEGSMVFISYDKATTAEQVYTGNITGGGDFLVSLGGGGATLHLSGESDISGLKELMGGGLVSEKGLASLGSAVDNDHAWYVDNDAYIAAKGTTGDELLGMVLKASRGTLALTQAQETDLMLQDKGYNSLIVGALAGLDVHYGTEGVALATVLNDDRQQWLLGGGGGNLIVDFALQNKNAELVLGNEYTTGTVTLTNAANSIGTITFKGQVTLEYTTEAALGQADVTLNYTNRLKLLSEGGLASVTENSSGVVLVDKTPDAAFDLTNYGDLYLGAAQDTVLHAAPTVAAGSAYRFGGIEGVLTLEAPLQDSGQLATDLIVDGQTFSGGVLELARAAGITGSVEVRGYDAERLPFGVQPHGDITLRLTEDNSLIQASGVTLEDGGILDIHGTSQTVRNLNTEDGSLVTSSTGGGVLTVVGDGDSHIAGVLDLYRLNKQGSGTMVLSGASLVDMFDVQEGILQATAAEALSGLVTVHGNGSLVLPGGTVDAILSLGDGAHVSVASTSAATLGGMVLEDGATATLQGGTLALPRQATIGSVGTTLILTRNANLTLSADENMAIHSTIMAIGNTGSKVTVSGGGGDNSYSRVFDSIGVEAGSTLTLEQTVQETAPTYEIRNLSGQGTLVLSEGSYKDAPAFYRLTRDTEFAGTFKILGNTGYSTHPYMSHTLIQSDNALAGAQVQMQGWGSDSGFITLGIDTENASIKGLATVSNSRSILMAGATTAATAQDAPVSSRRATLTITGSVNNTFQGRVVGGASGTNHGLSIVMNGSGTQTFNGSTVVFNNVSALAGKLVLNSAGLAINEDVTVARGAQLEIHGGWNLNEGHTLHVAGDASAASAALNNALTLYGGTIDFSGTALNSATEALHVSSLSGNRVSVTLSGTAALQTGTYLLANGDWRNITVNGTASHPYYELAFTRSATGLSVQVTQDTNSYIWNGSAGSHDWSATKFGQRSVAFGSGLTAVFSDAAQVRQVNITQDVTAGELVFDSTGTYTLGGAHRVSASSLIQMGSGTADLGGRVSINGEAGLTDGTLVMHSGDTADSVSIGEKATLRLVDADVATGTVSGAGTLAIALDEGVSANLSSIGADGIGRLVVESGTAVANAAFNVTDGVWVEEAGTLSLNPAALASVGGSKLHLEGCLKIDSASNYALGTPLGTSGETVGRLVITGGGTATVEDGVALNLAEVSIEGGTMLMKRNGSSERNINTLSLAGGTEFTLYGSTQPTEALEFAALKLTGATATVSNQHNSEALLFRTLSGSVESTTLNLVKRADSTKIAIFEFGGAQNPSADFTGKLALSSTDTGGRRSAVIVLDDALVAANASIDLASARSGDAILGLGVNADTVNIAGLDSASALGARAIVFSGGVEANADSTDTAFIGDGVARELVITTAEGADYSYHGAIGRNINLTIGGLGTQRFIGEGISADLNLVGGETVLDLAQYAGHATVGTGAELRFAGAHTVVSNLIETDGAVTLARDNAVLELDDDGDLVFNDFRYRDIDGNESPDGNGFAQGGSVQIFNLGEHASINLGTASIVYQGDTLELDANGVAWRGEKSSRSYTVRNGVVTYDEAFATKAATLEIEGFILSTALEETPAELEVTEDLPDDILIHSAGHGGILRLGENATLSASQLDAQASIKLAGAGRLDLDGTASLQQGVSLGENWTGTVRVRDFAPQSAQDLGALVRGTDSVLELMGFNGWGNTWDDTFEGNVKLTNGSNGYAWQNGAFSRDQHTSKFTGTWSGTGLFKVVGETASRWMHYTYSGNIAGWTGEFQKAGKQVTNLTFTGNATEVNIDITHVAGAADLNLYAGDGTAFETVFNGDVTAASLTVKNNASATFAGYTSISKGIANSGTLTNVGTLELGNITSWSGALVNDAQGNVVITSKLTTGTIDNYGTVTISDLMVGSDARYVDAHGESSGNGFATSDIDVCANGVIQNHGGTIMYGNRDVTAEVLASGRLQDATAQTAYHVNTTDSTVSFSAIDAAAEGTLRHVAFAANTALKVDDTADGRHLHSSQIVSAGTTTLQVQGGASMVLDSALNATVDVESGKTATLLVTAPQRADGPFALTKSGQGTVRLEGDEASGAHGNLSGSLRMFGGALEVATDNLSFTSISLDNGSGNLNRNIIVESGYSLQVATISNPWGIKTLRVDGVLNVSDAISFSTGGNNSTANNIITGSGIINTQNLTFGNVGTYNITDMAGLNVYGTLSHTSNHALNISGSNVNFYGLVNETTGNTTFGSAESHVTVYGTGGVNRFATLDMSKGGSAVGHVHFAAGTQTNVSTLWMDNKDGTFISLEKDAEVNLSGGVKIKGWSAEQEGDIRNSAGNSEYSMDKSSFRINHAEVAVDTASGAKSIGNTLQDVHLVNAGANALTENNAANTSFAGAEALNGDISFLNKASGLEVQDIVLGTGRTLSVYADATADEASEGALTVTGTLTARQGAGINADLRMASGSTLDVAATAGSGIALGSSLTLERGIAFSPEDYAAVYGLSVGDSYTLFTGVDELILNDRAYQAIVPEDKIDAVGFFRGIVPECLYMTYDGDNVGVYCVAVMPEPTTGTLSLLALCALAARRRRK